MRTPEILSNFRSDTSHAPHAVVPIIVVRRRHCSKSAYAFRSLAIDFEHLPKQLDRSTSPLIQLGSQSTLEYLQDLVPGEAEEEVGGVPDKTSHVICRPGVQVSGPEGRGGCLRG